MPIFKPQQRGFSGFVQPVDSSSLTAYRLLPTVLCNAFRQVFDHLRRGASTEVLLLLPFARRARDVS
jgi:hypothetical protein